MKRGYRQTYRVRLHRIITLLMALAVLVQTASRGGGTIVHAAEGEASTIRLYKTEGTVAISDGDGLKRINSEGMRLFSGNSISTAASSYAWLMLDDSKAAKLDAYSEAVIDKKGKDLAITLNAGKIFFDVTEKLAADESFTIKTSTMTMGIRGTIGVVEAADFNKTVLYLLEGEVDATVTNPETGEKCSGHINAGEIADADALVELPAGSTETITIRRVTRADITGFVLAEVAGGNTADAGRTRFMEHGGENVLSRRIFDATEEQLDLRGVQPGEAQQVLDREQAPVDPGFLDYHYYGVHNPDVVDELGTDPEDLEKHYKEFGQKEGRDPNTGRAIEHEEEKRKKEDAWKKFYYELMKLLEEETEAEEEKTYTISFFIAHPYSAQNPGGSDTCSTSHGSSAPAGAEVTVYASRLPGYNIGPDVRVIDSSGKVITSRNGTAASTTATVLTFTMPEGDVTINVT